MVTQCSSCFKCFFASIADKISSMPERDREREKRIERVKETIENGQYKMTETMVDSIAEKIANSLI